jgi:hypothetical protein
LAATGGGAATVGDAPGGLATTATAGGVATEDAEASGGAATVAAGGSATGTATGSGFAADATTESERIALTWSFMTGAAVGFCGIAAGVST